MTWKLSNRSKQKLQGVHPDLLKVVERALEISPYDFGITEGVRSLETQRQYKREGKSQTLKSKHLVQEDGYSHAVDIMVYVDGKGTWEHKHFRKVVQAFVTAAIELGVQLRFGNLWESFQDSPHIELNSKYY